MRHTLSAMAIVALLGGCGGGDGSGGTIGGGGADSSVPIGSGIGTPACSSLALREFVFDQMLDWYLFQELLPPGVTPASEPTPQALVDRMAGPARIAGFDRFFSGVTTITSDQAFFGEGQFDGFGFGWRETIVEGVPIVRITQVIPDSPAEAGGLARGQRIVALDGQALASASALSQRLSATPSGGSVVFTLRDPDGSEVQGTVTRGLVTTIPVVCRDCDPDGPRVLVFEREGLPAIGYLDFRSFISTAAPALNDAFVFLRGQNVTDLVIDVRYNGGGLVSIAKQLGDLIGGLTAQDEIFSELVFNPARNREIPSGERIDRFSALPGSLIPSTVVFITTSQSASASELMINGLAPHVDVRVVGSPTFGKPVGQVGRALRACDLLLRPVAFLTVNSLREGDYFSGLPVDCPADDDLDHPLGDPREASLATALALIETGSCELPVAETGMRFALAPPEYETGASHAVIYLNVY